MNVVVLGSTGMLGHVVTDQLRDICDELHTPFHGDLDLTTNKYITYLDSRDCDVIINCAGLIKHRLGSSINSVKTAYELNGLFPRNLSRYCMTREKQLIHISTDCVFNGKLGNYNEWDMPDAEDVYGVSKALGEVQGTKIMTIRTSIIGPEPYSSYGLFEWFKTGRRGTKKAGYVNHFFSGVTTVRLAREIKALLVNKKQLSGLYHLAGEPINKHDLLVKINDRFDLGIEVVPTETETCNRTLDCSLAIRDLNWQVPMWNPMLQELGAYIDAKA